MTDLLLHALMGIALVVAFKPYVLLGLAAGTALGVAREWWQHRAPPWRWSRHAWIEAMAWPAGGLPTYLWLGVLH